MYLANCKIDILLLFIISLNLNIALSEVDEMFICEIVKKIKFLNGLEQFIFDN